jgi:hypothetical protein
MVIPVITAGGAGRISEEPGPLARLAIGERRTRLATTVTRRR